MQTDEIEKLADEWVDTRRIGGSLENLVLDWELPFSNPEFCLDVIVRVLEKIDPIAEESLFNLLAFGPLEDLLIENGKAVVDRVEVLARTSPVFRRLLNVVMGSDVDESVKARLSKYLENPW